MSPLFVLSTGLAIAAFAALFAHRDKRWVLSLLTFAVAVAAISLIVTVVSVLSDYAACKESGGVYVSTFDGWTCLEVAP